MKVLDLFSGIGGFSLGLERAGMETVAFCEIDPYCRKVLRKHWPDVPIYEDVRDVSKDRLESDGITGIDVITGGFPCQDVSNSGKKGHATDSRTGLWTEIKRLVGEIRPRYVLMENVPGLLNRGMGDVLAGFSGIGYDVEWETVSAHSVGGFHKRSRIWFVAHPQGGRWKPIFSEYRVFQEAFDNCARLAGDRRSFYAPDCGRVLWETEPDICRVVDDVPNRMDRLKGLGNAVVPQIPEIIGRAILKVEFA